MYLYLYFVLLILFVTVAMYVLSQAKHKVWILPSGYNGRLTERVPKAHQWMMTGMEASKESDKFPKNSTIVDLGQKSTIFFSQHQVNREFVENQTGGIKAAVSVVHAQMEYEEDFMIGKPTAMKKYVQINEEHGNAGTGFVVNKVESMPLTNKQVVDKAETYFTNDVVTSGYDFGDKASDLNIITQDVPDGSDAKPTTHEEYYTGYLW